MAHTYTLANVNTIPVVAAIEKRGLRVQVLTRGKVNLLGLSKNVLMTVEIQTKCFVIGRARFDLELGNFVILAQLDVSAPKKKNRVLAKQRFESVNDHSPLQLTLKCRSTSFERLFRRTI